MNTRIAILLNFLQKTKNGDVPPNYALLRQVDSLVRQLPFVMNGFAVINGVSRRNGNDKLSKEFENEYNDMLVISYLATMAKTAKAIQGYTDKFRVVNSDSQRKAY